MTLVADLADVVLRCRDSPYVYVLIDVTVFIVLFCWIVQFIIIIYIHIIIYVFMFKRLLTSMFGA